MNGRVMVNIDGEPRELETGFAFYSDTIGDRICNELLVVGIETMEDDYKLTVVVNSKSLLVLNKARIEKEVNNDTISFQLEKVLCNN